MLLAEYGGEISGMSFNKDSGSFAYIPLSSFIILLVILITCASRRKKIDTLAAVEPNFEKDIKEEYAIMCFPCLKRKPDLQEYEPTTDLSDQFEYIVEKYTIKKVPLLLANTAEDIIERQEELEMGGIPESQPQFIKDDFVNFQLAQDVYNVQKMPTCIAVAANSTCPVRKSIKEKPKPSDVLESMSPVFRPNVKNPNYVVIPTKGSLRNKDIMMTKREITNQYLNNFSSVFVDNLKDQVPKDPDRFPSLSRPYTSALRNYPIPENIGKPNSKKSKKNKSQRVAYAFSTEENTMMEENSTKEEHFDDTDSIQEQTTDVPESEFPEDNENDTADFTDKSKSLILLNDSDSNKDTMECVPNPFKTTIKSSVPEIHQIPTSTAEHNIHAPSLFSQKDEWANSKSVTYEDIQALDVGYEFTSCEKLGVKPKMTRIHYPHESERLKESLKQLALGEPKPNKRSFHSQDQSLGSPILKPAKSVNIPKIPKRGLDSGLGAFPHSFFSLTEKESAKSIITETSFLPLAEHPISEEVETATEESPYYKKISSTTFTSKSEESKTHSINDITATASPTIDDSVTEISKMYELTCPGIQKETESASFHQKRVEPEQPLTRFPGPSKSRSFHEAVRSGVKSDNSPDGKGKDYTLHLSPKMNKNILSRVDEPETETSCSLYSRDSKTSSMTSPRSSEIEEGKRATLRWKIVIKHHRDEDPSKKNVNVNIKH